MANQETAYTSISNNQPAQLEVGFGQRVSNALKRIFDILLSAPGLLILSPFFLIIAAIIKSDSPGPVFYRGPRLGKGGKVFDILKFRTMYESPESYAGARITAQDDDRITKFGRWLRDSKLNELPQLWNVLIGEMSLVGPRPEDPQIGKDWPAHVRREVLSMPPGITSPASVLFRNEESLLKSGNVMDTYLGSIVPTKLRLDQLYVRHHSLLLDLDILLWTFLVLLPRLRGYVPPEERLFLGPFSRLVRQYVSWFAIDALITLLSIGLAGGVWRLFAPLNAGWPKAIAVGGTFVVFFSLTGVLLGVNKIMWSQANLIDAFDLIPGLVVATGMAVWVNKLWVVHAPLPLSLILYAAGVSFAGSVVIRYRSRLARDIVMQWIGTHGWAAEAQERMLIIGGGDTGQFVTWMLNRRGTVGGFRIVGYVDDDLFKQGTRIQGVNVIGRREDIPALVAKYDVGVIIFAIHNISEKEREQLLDICARTPARLLLIPDLIGDFNQSLAASLDASNPGLSPAQRGTNPSSHPVQARLSPQQLDVLLADLAKKVEQGDLEALRQKISQARAELQEQEDISR
jgi:lipopolysaccharide/colanic/teichoic acid biosynthesis glycosyltransferase